MKQTNRIVLAISITGAVVLHAAAYAQTSALPAATGSSSELEEIVVTAERRTSDVQKTAISVSVRNGDVLKDQGRYSLTQILEDVVGVAATPALGAGGGGTDTQGGSIIIRGAVPNGGAPGGDVSSVPSTAVYADGIYEGIGGAYDVDRVEVLRGPQGTLYGRSATGGVVATYTRNPVLNNFNVDLAGEFGSYALRHATMMVNVPMGSTFALRISGNEYDRDGYLSADGGKTETTEARAKLLFQPSEDFSAVAGAALQYNHSHTGGVLVNQPTPNTYSFTPSPMGSGSNHFKQYWANVNWNLGPATLTYLPSLRNWYQDSNIVATGPAPGSIITQLEYTPSDQFVTHELRLASNPNSKLTWQVGSIFYDNRLQNTNVVHLIPPGGLIFGAVTSKETKDLGSFGEATYPFTSSWRLTAGVRYDYTYVQTNEAYTANKITGAIPEDNTTLSISGSPATRRFYNITYKLRLEEDLTKDNLMYVSVSTGFLPGDVSVTSSQDAVTGKVTPLAYPYAEETLTAYELGSKNRFLNDSLQINGDVYYYSYGGYQTIVNTGVSPLVPNFVTAVSPARMKGMELEGLYQLTDNDRIGLNYAYIHAFFVDRTPLFLQFVAQSRITAIAPVTATASYDHTFKYPGGSSLAFHGDARYASAHDVSVLTPAQFTAGYEPYVRVGGEWITDMSVTWASPTGKYSVTGYVRNIGDNEYKISAGVQTSPSFTATATPYDPRTLGMVIKASF